MRIFYAGCEYDHADPKRLRSFEHENFYLSLKAMPGVEVVYFPFERILEIGRQKFNESILDAVRCEKPDLFFAYLYSDELEPAMLEQLKKETKTVAWFADDSWRFYNYTKFWAKYFTWAVTTYSYMPPLYVRAGQPNVIRSQWAADINTYRPSVVGVGSKAGVAGPMVGSDVAFIGSWSRPRAKIIAHLAAEGIPVATYGGGWPSSRISQEDMLHIFSTSKINLALNPPPGFFNINSLGRLVAQPSLNKIVPYFHLISNVESWLHRGIPQIKARHFEIPACGGFMMTSRADDLETFYARGKEAVFYDNVDDMVKKIRYYLAPEHEAERVAIARAGYERTIREHTYQKRFEEIFKKIGLPLTALKNS